MSTARSHIVFDLDGTLVESLPGIAAGLNASLAEMGKPTHTESAIRHMIGRGASNLCAQALGYTQSAEAPEQELRALLAAFSRFYPEAWQNGGTTIYPGVTNMLMQLTAKGAHMAVLSNKPHEVTSVMVQKLFRGFPLAPVLGYQKGVMPRKPSPEALQFIAAHWGIQTSELTLVGDSIHDAHTAQNAGCPLILVPWGYAHMEQLIEWKNKHPQSVEIVGSAIELTRLLLGQ